MKMPELSLIEWQRRCATEKDYAEALTRVRWPDGFILPVCAGKFSAV